MADNDDLSGNAPGVNPETTVSIKKKEEEALLNNYRKNPTPENFTALYRAYKPLIFSAARNNIFGSPLPKSAHMALAAQSFMDAVRTWKPGLRQFKSHAFDAVRNKGKRLNLTYQNVGYIPEQRLTKYQTFTNAMAMLKEQLGRPPSNHELADELAWPVSKVELMRREIKSSFVLDETQSDTFELSRSNEILRAGRDVLYTLTPKHQVVLEHLLGLNGKQVFLKPSGGTDINALSRACGLSVPDIRSALKTITRKIRAHRGYIDQGPG